MSGTVPVRMAGPAQLSNAAATKYTVPANRNGIVRHTHVSNPSANQVLFTMSIGADAAGTRIFDSFVIQPNSVLDHFGLYVLAAGQIIQAFAGTNNVLTLTIDGEEEVLA